MIRDRRIAPNDRLPPERVLAAGLNVSLGTIQKALEALVLDGFVVRELGRGSFVSEYRESFSGPWHHRFVRPGDSTVLPVRTSLVYRRIVRRRGPWSDALGSDPGGYVCIARRVSAGDEVMCFTRTWLPAEHCLGLLDIPAGEIVGENCA
jgi:DNA-binding GntR family transcriptional regulator